MRLFLAALLSLGFAGLAEGAGNDDVEVALHVKTATTKSSGVCDSNAPTEPCSDYVTSGSLTTPYNVYLVAARGDAAVGIAGYSVGIYYDEAVEVFDFINCTDLYFPGGGPNGYWPASYSGSIFTWNTSGNCQTNVIGSDGVHAIAGGFYVYAYGEGVMSTTLNYAYSTGHELLVADCAGVESSLPATALGAARFSASGTVEGYNPCTGAGAQPIIPAPPDPGPGPDLPPGPDPVNGYSSIMLHIAEELPGPQACADAPVNLEDIVVEAPAAYDGSLTYTVYVLSSPETDFQAGTPDGLLGLQFAIEYPSAGLGSTGLSIDGWSRCSDVEFAQVDWPDPGSGNTLTWANCVERAVVPSGYFTVTAYTESYLAIVPYGPSGLVKTATCQNVETVIDEDRWGWVSFGGGSLNGATGGCNAAVEQCTAPVAVEEITWGRLKTKY